MILLNNVHTSLLLSSSKNEYSQSYLFHCAKYWANQGDWVLYISKSRVKNLPPAVNKPDVEYNPDTFSKIRFMYLPRWQDFLLQLYQIHTHPHPVSLIIVEELHHYCKEDGNFSHDHASLICASLLNAAAVCSTRTNKPSYVICSYFSKESSIDMTLIKNYFNNLWHLQVQTDDRTIKLTSLVTKFTKKTEITFSVNSEISVLTFKEILKVFGEYK